MRLATCEIRIMRVRVGELEIYVEVHGRGIPLLLINGMDSSSCDGWKRSQVPVWSSEYQVVLYDQRGTGRSQTPAAGYSTRDLAAEAVGVLDALGIEEPTHVLGTSMGGRIAQWLVLDYPQRVRALVLAATGPGQYKAGFEPTRGIPLHVAEGLIEKGYATYMFDHLGGAVFFPSEVATTRPGLVEEARAAFLNHMMPLESYLRHTIARQHHQTYERLGEIHAPTLLVCGERDTIVLSTGNHVESSQAMAALIPDAELVVIDGAAHNIFGYKSDQTNAVVLDFLRRH